VSQGILFVVATPIGNLEDMTPRARQVLADVDLIAAEDTRHTGKLLSHFGIKTQQIALHDHNEERATERVVDELQHGRSVALVSDAGTPLISDPGYRAVRRARDMGISVLPVPGACAATAAMSVAGLPSDRYNFEGFLPAKGESRRSVLRNLARESCTLVFYESVYRIADCIDDMRGAFGDSRKAFVAREISKLHEQYVRGDLAKIAGMLESGEIVKKGEFVVVVAGTDQDADEPAGIASQDLLVELMGLVPGKQAVEIVSRLSGRRRNEVYREMLALQEDR